MRTIRPWEEVCCDLCGDEFLGARTTERVIEDGEKLLCTECEMYERGYDDGFRNDTTKQEDKKIYNKQQVRVLYFDVREVPAEAVKEALENALERFKDNNDPYIDFYVVPIRGETKVEVFFGSGTPVIEETK